MINLLNSAVLRRGPLPTPDPQFFRIGDQEIVLRFRRNAQAKRMVLRLDRKIGLVMTLPPRSSLSEALAFARKSEEWIIKVLAKKPLVVALGDGSLVLFRGVACKVHFTGGTRGLVRFEGSEVFVPGAAQHATRRLKDAMQKIALEDLQACSRKYAVAMNAKFSRITLRDQKSRWGSCSSSGALSYSWRLILTPPMVLDYVCAHEVAHLLEMNHGPRFWRLVLKHCPNAHAAKEWLKAHGAEVHRYFQ